MPREASTDFVNRRIGHGPIYAGHRRAEAPDGVGAGSAHSPKAKQQQQLMAGDSALAYGPMVVAFPPRRCNLAGDRATHPSAHQRRAQRDCGPGMRSPSGGVEDRRIRHAGSRGLQRHSVGAAPMGLRSLRISGLPMVTSRPRVGGRERQSTQANGAGRFLPANLRGASLIHSRGWRFSWDACQIAVREVEGG